MAVQPFVVVIDDDASVRRAVGRLLRIAEMEIETYSSGEKFLLAVLHREPDCVVLAVRMAGLTGPELREKLHSEGRRIPAVFITAYDQGVTPASSSGLANAEILYKPFGDQSLLDAISRAMLRDTAS